MTSIPPVQGQSYSSSPQPSQVIINQKGRSLFGRFLSLLGILVIVASIGMNFILMAAVGVYAQEQVDFATTTYKKGANDQIVALYTIEDTITAKTTEEFRKFYRKVADDDNVKAVLLRVNSPGGGAGASDEIWKMVEDLKGKGKKVVASFGPLAASGGYYISAGADEIVAEPTTITGSIGVIMTLPNLEGTMDKLGIKMNTIMSTNSRYWKDIGSPFTELSPKDREMLLALLDDMQAQFEKVVRKGRGKKLKITQKKVKEPVTRKGQTIMETFTETVPFNGQIFRSKDALKIGLIDSIGYLEDAWNKAAEIAKLDNPKVVKYHRRTGIFVEMMEGLTPFREAAEKTTSPRILYQWYVQ
jgi:protease-4